MKLKEGGEVSMVVGEEKNTEIETLAF